MVPEIRPASFCRYIVPVCIALAVFMSVPVSGVESALHDVSLTAGSSGSSMSAADYERAGMALMAQKNWSGLAALTDEGLALYPDDSELHCLRAYGLRKTGHFSEAADNVTFAINRDPRPVRYANRGFAYLAMGQNDAALADADSALSMDASYATAYGVKAVALLNTGNLTGAGQAVDSAISLSPSDPFYRQVKGRILAAGGNCSGAMEAFSASLALDPAYDLPWPGFGNATTDLSQTESRCRTPPPAPTPAPTRAALLPALAVAAIVTVAVACRRR